MAEDTAELKTLLSSVRPDEGEFTPCAYYGPEEDALVFYFRNDPDYAKRLNSRVTLYLSLASNELVGCQIKGVKRVLDDIGWFDVSISHGKVKLKLLFVALHATIPDDPESRSLYRRLGEAASQTELEVEVQSPAP